MPGLLRPLTWGKPIKKEFAMNGELPPGVRRKLYGPTPFGWRDHDELPGMIEEVPEEQALLRKAFEHLDLGCTYNATAKWVMGHDNLRPQIRSDQLEAMVFRSQCAERLQGSKLRSATR